MQTSFSLVQLADPNVAESNRILRACVHCGFCTATCPTYVLLGDELDSPRGRIYLIKDMLEHDRPATPEVVKHIDRCLSCLACMTTCPSGVHYMHLVDHARVHIEKTYRRPLSDRLLRDLLAKLLPNPRLFRAALFAAFFARPLAPLFAALGLTPLAAMLRLAPSRLPPRRGPAGRRVHSPAGPRKGRVALLSGCANQALRPAINGATIRLLTRLGIEVVVPAGEGCCGSLVHHMGREDQAHAGAKANIDAWMAEIEGEGLDAIVINISGCGTTVKDYGFMLRTDPAYAGKAARVSALARDISEYLSGLELPAPAGQRGLAVAYHAACSLQHGQRIVREPKELLSKLGFVVEDIPEGHLCCGSAGTYNIVHADIARRLRDRKIERIEQLEPDVIAAGNIGCIAQIATGTAIPVVHPVELLDWATGGPRPAGVQEGDRRTPVGDRQRKLKAAALMVANRSGNSLEEGHGEEVEKVEEGKGQEGQKGQEIGVRPQEEGRQEKREESGEENGEEKGRQEGRAQSGGSEADGKPSSGSQAIHASASDHARKHAWHGFWLRLELRRRLPALRQRRRRERRESVIGGEKASRATQ